MSEDQNKINNGGMENAPPVSEQPQSPEPNDLQKALKLKEQADEKKAKGDPSWEQDLEEARAFYRRWKAYLEGLPENERDDATYEALLTRKTGASPTNETPLPKQPDRQAEHFSQQLGNSIREYIEKYLKIEEEFPKETYTDQHREKQLATLRKGLEEKIKGLVPAIEDATAETEKIVKRKAELEGRAYIPQDTMQDVAFMLRRQEWLKWYSEKPQFLLGDYQRAIEYGDPQLMEFVENYGYDLLLTAKKYNDAQRLRDLVKEQKSKRYSDATKEALGKFNRLQRLFATARELHDNFLNDQPVANVVYRLLNLLGQEVPKANLLTKIFGLYSDPAVSIQSPSPQKTQNRRRRK